MPQFQLATSVPQIQHATNVSQIQSPTNVPQIQPTTPITTRPPMVMKMQQTGSPHPGSLPMELRMMKLESDIAQLLTLMSKCQQTDKDERKTITDTEKTLKLLMIQRIM